MGQHVRKCLSLYARCAVDGVDTGLINHRNGDGLKLFRRLFTTNVGPSCNMTTYLSVYIETFIQQSGKMQERHQGREIGDGKRVKA